jgi:capsular polysaccharide biosynthesis protein
VREFRWSYVNPYCILRDLLINLWVILLCVAIAWMGTQIVLENLHKPEYTSTTTYFITPKDSSNTAYPDISSGYQIAGILSTLFESQILAQKAAEAMGLRRLPAKLITSVVEYTNLLRLQVVAASPELAFRTIVAIMETHPKVADYVVNNAVAEVLEPQPCRPPPPTSSRFAQRSEQHPLWRRFWPLPSL